MKRKHDAPRCSCGRPVTAGRSEGRQDYRHCLICETAEVMKTFVYPPPKRKVQHGTA